MHDCTDLPIGDTALPASRKKEVIVKAKKKTAKKSAKKSPMKPC
jgi:hypothetical protein